MQEHADTNNSKTNFDFKYTVSTQNVSQKPEPNNAKNYLVAFDFDYTIVAQNTDTVARDLLPQKLLTKDLEELISKEGWTQYMAKIFQLLQQEKITKTKICDTIRSIPEVPGFVRLIKRLKQNPKIDLIIISDSNSIFIQEWLQAHNLKDCFTDVFTNPAHFDENGILNIKPYHHQTSCQISAPNLCKGQVLEHFLIKQDLRHNLRYDHVIYVGDGNNDLCPVYKLRYCDIGCARIGFAMDKKLQKNKDKMCVRAKLLFWNNGFDLLEQLEKSLKLPKPEDN